VPTIPFTQEQQLQRQLAWLSETWMWLMRTRVLKDLDGLSRPMALDVGCGPGLVMDLFSSMLTVKGVDIDADMVRRVKEKGKDAVLGDAEDLPFDDNSFDLAYCSFTLLWVKDPDNVIKEMARVARRFVICLAEPDYGGRICHPKEIAELDGALIDSLIAEGADPFIGRKLAHMMYNAGLEVRSGVHSGIWSPEQLKEEADAEWNSLARAVEGRVGIDALDRSRSAWDRALGDGSLFLYNPVFYAIGRKR